MISTPETRGEPDEAEPRTRVHASDRDTSHEAAESLTNGILKERQRMVYEILLESNGLTDDELRREVIARAGAASKSGPASRRHELELSGWVRPAVFHGMVLKRLSDAGKRMTVWDAVPESEYVAPTPPEPVDPIDPAALAVARRVARWEFGDADMGERIVRAYLNPQAAQAALDEEMSDD